MLFMMILDYGLSLLHVMTYDDQRLCDVSLSCINLYGMVLKDKLDYKLICYYSQISTCIGDYGLYTCLLLAGASCCYHWLRVASCSNVNRDDPLLFIVACCKMFLDDLMPWAIFLDSD